MMTRSIDPLLLRSSFQDDPPPVLLLEVPRRPTATIPIRKRTGANPFPRIITIGSEASNDIVVSGPGVREFHAYFVFTPALVVVDSSGATRRNGVPLERGEPVDLVSGDQIALGGVRFRYLDADHARTG